MSDVDNVRVALRVRPLVSLEIDRGCQIVVTKTPGRPQVCVNNSDVFTFNHVFDPSNTQEEIYNESVSEMLDKLFAGFNATILAYGQTGSGKTHTMGTQFDGELTENVGVIPRAMHDIFARIERLSSVSSFVVACSFMELYQEQLFDLLSPRPREESIIEMREDRTGIIMPGLTEQLVHSATETTDCLVRGSMGRAVGSTAMNQQSSRSHAIFTVTIQATRKDETETVTTSKFHLVDLAGSERSKKTQATGDRFKEGVKINQGLLALGNVISALGANQGTGFVRYRDSKLTRLLQDSLGGNSVTLMIACVSPADYNVAETLSTLRYADRARQIKNKPIINQDPHAAEINRLKGIIQKLKMELLASGGSLSSSMTGVLKDVTPVSSGASLGEFHSKAYKELQEKYRNLQQQLQATLHDVAENELRAHLAEVSHEKLKAQTDEMRSLVSNMERDLSPDAEPLLRDRIHQMNRLVYGLDEELERTQNEIGIESRTCSMSSLNGESDVPEVSPEMQSMLQEQSDEYTSKQMTFKEQLKRINRELNLKEQLQQRVVGNLDKFCTLDNNVEEKFRECESKIKELENEKADLVDKLRHVKENASAKLAEERRRRLQVLEQEIGDMKRKNVQQAKLLKVREKETEKIKNLSKEIQAMKESKVKLIRAMRAESEKFRQWKMTREKELMQLKNKDRKLQSEMARKEALHTKQRNVLKRKCEEAMAINKRLKDALERQKAAQSQRQKLQSGKDVNAASTKIEQVLHWVDRELEVIISIIDGEMTLEQMKEDCSVIVNRMADLEVQQQHQQSLESADEQSSAVAQELASLQEELDMRKEQIADLQARVNATDVQHLIETLCDGMQSLGEVRAALKHLFKAITDMRREHAVRLMEQRAVSEEQRAQREAAEERCAMVAKRMRLAEIEHEEAIAERENTYEEKIAVLLRELHNAPQVGNDEALTPDQEELMRIQQEQLDKMDSMREELESYKTLVAEMQSRQLSQPHKAKRMKIEPKSSPVQFEDIALSSENDEPEEIEYKNDPDWKKTPRYSRSKRRQTTRHSNSDRSSNLEESFVTAASGALGDSSGSNTTTAAGTKRVLAASIEHNDARRRHKRCTCRGNCGNKRCGCYSSDQKCSLNCLCDGSSCSNGKFKKITEDKEEDGQGAGAGAGEKKKPVTTPPLLSESEEDMKSPENIEDNSHFPAKMARISTISFNTPSMKKKFFG